MKKWKIVMIIAVLLCMLPFCTALAKTGKVTASALNMRKKADADSKVVRVLHEGDKITINDTSGGWYKVSIGKDTGYVSKKYVEVSSDDSKSSNKSDDSKKSDKKTDKKEENKKSDGTCGPGDTGDAVKKVQKKLKKLGYYSGNIDGDYGNGTKKAVKSFQKDNGIKQDGTVGDKTWAALTDRLDSLLHPPATPTPKPSPTPSPTPKPTNTPAPATPVPEEPAEAPEDGEEPAAEEPEASPEPTPFKITFSYRRPWAA